MKIYTKTGDRGRTSLLGGSIVPKDHPRLDAYGTLDELNAWMGLLRDILDDQDIAEILAAVQDKLMAGSAILAAEREEHLASVPGILEDDITALEKAIDHMDKNLPPLTNFILPGGHTHISFCHLARTTCRRAERLTVRLMEESEPITLLVKYLNRLSDFLFVLCRKIASDLDIEEKIWQAGS
jgi:cob(I)alamin adenosyltransferase